MRIRQSVCAGSWYPGSSEELADVIDNLLEQNQSDIDPSIKAIIVPHAGYQYSGAVAASAFSKIKSAYDKVFLLGPSHRFPLSGVSIPDATHYETPLGLVEISPVAKNIISGCDFCESVEAAHQSEHSLEIEIPFLQRRMTDLSIVPILVGRTDPDLLSGLLNKNLGNNDLLVVSVDLSHFHPYREAVKLDKNAIDKILGLDHRNIRTAEIDGPFAVAALILLAIRRKWRAKLIKYANSGDVTDDHSSVVGYASISFSSQ